MLTNFQKVINRSNDNKKNKTFSKIKDKTSELCLNYFLSLYYEKIEYKIILNC